MARYMEDVNDYSGVYGHVTKNIQFDDLGRFFLIICIALGVYIGYKKYNSPITGGIIGLLTGVITILLIFLAISNILILIILAGIILYIIFIRRKNNKCNVQHIDLSSDLKIDKNSPLISNSNEAVQNLQDNKEEKDDVETLLNDFEKALSEKKAQNKKNEISLREKALHIARTQIEIAINSKQAGLDQSSIKYILSQHIHIENSGEIKCCLSPKNGYLDYSNEDALKTIYITNFLSEDEKYTIYKLWYEINKNDYNTYWEDWYKQVIKKL